MPPQLHYYQTHAILLKSGPLAQVVELLPFKQAVTGSSPVRPILHRPDLPDREVGLMSLEDRLPGFPQGYCLSSRSLHSRDDYQSPVHLPPTVTLSPLVGYWKSV